MNPEPRARPDATLTRWRLSFRPAPHLSPARRPHKARTRPPEGKAPPYPLKTAHIRSSAVLAPISRTSEPPIRPPAPERRPRPGFDHFWGHRKIFFPLRTFYEFSARFSVILCGSDFRPSPDVLTLRIFRARTQWRSYADKVLCGKPFHRITALIGSLYG